MGLVKQHKAKNQSARQTIIVCRALVLLFEGLIVSDGFHIRSYI